MCRSPLCLRRGIPSTMKSRQGGVLDAVASSAVNERFAPGHLPGGRLLWPERPQWFVQDSWPGAWLQEGQFFAGEGVHNSPDLGIAQLRLGLPFKLRIPKLDADDGRQPLPDILSGKIGAAVFEQVVLAGIVVECPGQGRFKTNLMGSALLGAVIIGKEKIFSW